MAIKKLFGNVRDIPTIEGSRPSQVEGITGMIASASFDTLVEFGIESPEYIEAYIKDRDKFIPAIDFTTASNFAKYGSAEQYYEDAVTRIHRAYPYDGSAKERLQWHNSSSYLDRYVFDKLYPRRHGYAQFAYDGWGTQVDSANGYGATATASYEYVQIKGGPHAKVGGTDHNTIPQLYSERTGSNVYSSLISGSGTRESNLKTALSGGVTIEFWLKKPAFSTSKTEREVIFDLWNGVTTSGSEEYGRLRLELSGTATADESPFRFTILSGNTGVFDTAIGSGITTASLSSWKHYALSLANDGNSITAKFYITGTLNQTVTTTNSSIGEITGSLIANIGALRSTPSGATGRVGEGWGKLSGSLDEFRFWKVKRTSKDIGRYWFSQVFGGTNTDEANTTLGVYYKFNEGNTGTSSIDKKVLDYSGRISNGTWTGYQDGSRHTGSAILEASASSKEFKDPIIYSSNDAVANLLVDLKTSGSLYDYRNSAAIYNSLPDWIIEEDGDNEAFTIRKLTQVLSSYFDSAHLQIESLPKLQNTTYFSGSDKPYPFTSTMLRSYGFITPDLFEEAGELEELLDRDENSVFDTKIHNIKNIIYRNIYNNLVHIYKTKGTEKSFRNLIRCFGIDDELLKINLYANNITYEIKPNTRATVTRKKYANFFDAWTPTSSLDATPRNNATVYQYPSGSNSVSFISGSKDLGYEDDVPITVECEVIFPVRDDAASDFYLNMPPASSSLFGLHTANTASATELTWNTNDYANLQVFAVRPDSNINDIKFVLTSSNPFPIPAISSSVYTDVYEDNKWNLAVTIKPTKFGFASSVSGAASGTYTVELYGVNMIADQVVNEFSASTDIANPTGKYFLRQDKRLYIGAHRTNFTGSVLQGADTKIGSVRYWLSNLSHDDIKAHAKDASTFGISDPYKHAYALEQQISGVYIPRIDTLALHWDFAQVTGSTVRSTTLTTEDAQFAVADASSGSSNHAANRHHWLGNIIDNQHTGRGDFYLPNDTGSVDLMFVQSEKQRQLEVLSSTDMIEIRSQDDVTFTREHRPINHYFALEKSMYQSISEDMINMFASILDYNNLIGEPVNRYRQEYKDLSKLRQLFFERIENTPDLDRYIEYYKWIDSALSKMVMQLIPASANVTEHIRTMVESHALERNKYWTKFPSLEFAVSDPEGSLLGVNELLYDWTHGHAPGYKNTNLYALTIDSGSNGQLNIGTTSTWDALIGDNPSTGETKGFTLSAWIHPKSYGPNEDYGYGRIFDFSAGDVRLYFANKTGDLKFEAKWTNTGGTGNNGQAIWTFDSNIPLNAWSHVALSYNAEGTDDDPVLYVNGISYTPTENTAPAGAYFGVASSDDLYVGNRADADRAFNGFIDEVAIFKHALTSAEVGEIHSGDTLVWTPPDIRNHSSASSLAAYYRMGDHPSDTSSRIYDATNNGRTGVISGSSSVYTITSIDKFNALWWRDRAERDGATITSGDDTIDSQRGGVKTVITTIHSASAAILSTSGSSPAARTRYQVSTYARRRLARPYRFKIENDQRKGSGMVIHGGINYGPSKRRDLAHNALQIHGPTSDLGVPRNILVIRAEDLELIDSRDDEYELDATRATPWELKKRKYAFKAQSGRDYNLGYESCIKGEIYTPFNIYSSSVQISTGYQRGLVNHFLSGTLLTNIHSDTYGPDNDVPMQGPFTERYVGGHQSRHVDVNAYDISLNTSASTIKNTPNRTDDMYTRPEAWRLLVWDSDTTPGYATGTIGFVGADYGGPYPDFHKKRATYFRDGTAKRPVNIQNIRMITGSTEGGSGSAPVNTRYVSGTLHSSLGNFQKLYQVIQANGRTANNRWWRDNADSASAPFDTANGVPWPTYFKTRDGLGGTTHIHSLIGVEPNPSGNIFITGDPNTRSSVEHAQGNRVRKPGEPLDDTTTQFKLPDRGRNEAVMASRFSAPGGPEVNSRGYLDRIAEEYSVHNALPYRNLSILGSGSGEITTNGIKTLRVNDHTGHARGLNLLMRLHCGRFGSDPTYGANISELEYVTSASFHKVNRNPSKKLEIDLAPAALDNSGIAYNTLEDKAYQINTGTVKDNAFVQRPIPASDFGYAWITASANRLTNHLLFGHAPANGLLTQSAGYESAITFITASEISISASVDPSNLIYGDFVGLNILISQSIDLTNNLLNIITGTTAGNLPNEKYENTAFGNLTPAAHTASLGKPHNPRGHAFNILMLNRNGPYQHPSWKQVRTGEHKIARILRKENQLSIIDESTKLRGPAYSWPDEINPTRGTSDYVKRKYYEPPLVISHKPIIHLFNPSTADQRAYGLTLQAAIHTYGNNLHMFNHNQLNDKLAITNNSRQIYEDLTMQFTEPQEVGGAGSDLPEQLVSIKYCQVIYPKITNTFSGTIRGRPAFTPDFWRNKRTGSNSRDVDLLRCSQGFDIHTGSMWVLDARRTFASGTAATGSRGGTYIAGLTSSTTAATGEFQNTHTHVHDGTTVQCQAAPLYALKHTITTASSLMSPNGQDLHDGVPTDTGVQLSGNFFGEALWEAGDQRGKTPFYNSYADFVANLRTIGKEYSVVPEFRISALMEFYIGADGAANGDFLADKDDFLQLQGAAVDSELAESSGDSSFYKIYTHSEFLKYFNMIEQDYTNTNVGIDAVPKILTMTCRGMMKFLPYELFYPAYRIKELATFFSKSYGPFVKITGSSTNRSVTATNVTRSGDGDGGSIQRLAGWRPFLQPFFAPGLMMNSIKSGMAVDWPIIIVSGSGRTGASPGLITTKVVDEDTSPGQWSKEKTDPMYLIQNDGFDLRLPFDTLIEPEKIMGLSLVDNDPHPSCSLNATASWNGEGDKLYKYAMHNFLAAVPEFFLDGGRLTSLYSLPESQFKRAEAGTSYEMMIRLGKTFKGTPDALRMVVGQQITGSWAGYATPQRWRGPILGRHGTLAADALTPVAGSPDLNDPKYFEKENICMYSRPSAFGFPCQGHSGSTTSHNGLYPGYTPPYYDGESYLWLRFIPPETRKYKLTEIFSLSTSSFYRFEQVMPLGVGAKQRGNGPYGTSESNLNNNSMQITASCEVFGIADNDPTAFLSSADRGGSRWAIHTKWETPILNFANVGVTTASVDYPGHDNEGEGVGPGGLGGGTYIPGFEAIPKGMWHQYGEIPKQNEAIFMQVADIPKSRQLVTGSPQYMPGAVAPHKTGSLIDLVGFSRDRKDLGRIAEGRDIREAIVAIPFIEPINSDSGPQFIKIEPEMIKEALSLIRRSPDINWTQAADPSAQIALPEDRRVGRSTIQMVAAMRRYVLPPKFDFLYFNGEGNRKTVDPIAMYIFEFTHSLTQDELSDIWQNLPPKLGRAFDSGEGDFPHTDDIMQNSTIQHPLDSPYELLNRDLLREPTLRWMVFKVKQRAANNYYQTLANVGQKRSDMEIIEERSRGEIPYFSFNWPYDYFSLVEMIKIDEQIDFETGIVPILPENVTEFSTRQADRVVEEGASTTSATAATAGTAGTAGGATITTTETTTAEAVDGETPSISSARVLARARYEAGLERSPTPRDRTGVSNLPGTTAPGSTPSGFGDSGATPSGTPGE